METLILLNIDSLLQTKLTLVSGENCDLHLHERTHETYTIIIGEGIIQNGEEKLDVRSGSFVHIEPKVPHKITNTGILPLIVLSTKDSNKPDIKLC